MQVRQPMSPAVKIFFGRVFPWPFILIGALVSFIGIRNFVQTSESVNWPIAQGIIRTSSVEYHSSNKGGTYHAHIFYNYNLNGATYSGDRVAYGDYGSSNPSHAQEIVNRYPAGKNVTIYYMPNEPEECLLEPGIKPQTWLVPGFGIVFFSTGIVMVVFLPKLFEKAYQADHQFDVSNKIS
jgi:hypothetical protein